MLDILDCAGMCDYKPCSTPVDTHSKLSAADGTSVSDPTHYHIIAGALLYVSYFHSSGYRLCCSASMLAYARPQRPSSCYYEADSAVLIGQSGSRPSPLQDYAD